MGETRHTPGPWEVGTATANFPTQIGDQYLSVGNESLDRGICRVSPLTTIDDQDEANASLIAAAPELLAALEGLISIGKRDLSNPKYDGYFEAARAAIAKAEGRA